MTFYLAFHLVTIGPEHNYSGRFLTSKFYARRLRYRTRSDSLRLAHRPPLNLSRIDRPNRYRLELIQLTGLLDALAARVQRQQQKNKKASGEESDGQHTKQLLPARQPCSSSCDRRRPCYTVDRPSAVSRMMDSGRRITAEAVGHLRKRISRFLR